MGDMRMSDTREPEGYVGLDGIGWGHPLSGTKDWMGPPTLRYQGNVDGP